MGIWMSTRPIPEHDGFGFGHDPVSKKTLGEAKEFADVALGPSRAIECHI
jgi:hypothetical protein